MLATFENTKKRKVNSFILRKRFFRKEGAASGKKINPGAQEEGKWLINITGGGWMTIYRRRWGGEVLLVKSDNKFVEAVSELFGRTRRVFGWWLFLCLFPGWVSDGERWRMESGAVRNAGRCCQGSGLRHTRKIFGEIQRKCQSSGNENQEEIIWFSHQGYWYVMHPLWIFLFILFFISSFFFFGHFLLCIPI